MFKILKRFFHVHNFIAIETGLQHLFVCTKCGAVLRVDRV